MTPILPSQILTHYHTPPNIGPEVKNSIWEHSIFHVTSPGDTKSGSPLDMGWGTHWTSHNIKFLFKCFQKSLSTYSTTPCPITDKLSPGTQGLGPWPIHQPPPTTDNKIKPSQISQILQSNHPKRVWYFGFSFWKKAAERRPCGRSTRLQYWKRCQPGGDNDSRFL